MPFALGVQALADIIVSTGRQEAGIGVHGPFISDGLLNTEADLLGYRQLRERFPAAAHANKIGTAINHSSVVVVGESFDAVIADHPAVHRDLADTQGNGIV